MRALQSTLLFRWFDEVWNQGHENVIDELVHPEARIRGLAEAALNQGPAAFRTFYQQFHNQFTDIRIDTDIVVSEDDYEVARCRTRARHRASGHEVDFTGLCLVHLKDGQIHEGWNEFDFLTMYQQLGMHLVADDAAAAPVDAPLGDEALAAAAGPN
ncbi:ester cyclase [Hymenobacter sp. B81]|uniref:ester cyclase n=1 Tax=Hymenobacter sp. B81 TaxID=3344878 RepID=UPI0037DDC4F1